MWDGHASSLDNTKEKHSIPQTKNKITKTFEKILRGEESNQQQFTTLILSHIRTLPLDLRHQMVDRSLVKQLCKNFLKYKDAMFQQKSDDLITVTNFLWLLQTYGCEIEDSPYIFEEITDYVEVDDKLINHKSSYFFYCRLLTTGVHIFSCYPSESQHILGKVFELCKGQNNPELEEKVVVYSKLLQCDSFYK